MSIVYANNNENNVAGRDYYMAVDDLGLAFASQTTNVCIQTLPVFTTERTTPFWDNSRPFYCNQMDTNIIRTEPSPSIYDI